MGRNILTGKELRIQLKDSKFRLVGKFNGTREVNRFKSLECGHEFDMLLRNLKRKVSNNNHLCPECENKLRQENLKKDSLDIYNYVYKSTQREYKLISNLSETYKNNKSPITILHKTCGKSFTTNFSNFQIGRRCPYCAKKSKESNAAQLIKRLLEQVKIEFREEETFSECINPFTDKLLRFDLYLPKLNILIEIDGEQHYIPIKRFGGTKSLIDCQYRDAIKNKFCYKNQIELIRISLFDIKENKKKSYEQLKLEVFLLLKELVERK